MSKKKIGIIIAVVIVVIAAAGGGAWYLLNGNLRIGNSSDKVYVEKVANLNSSNSGAQNRYSGVVEAQESWKVNKDAEREVKEVFVEVGDMVEEGDSLFEYNMEDVEAELSQAELDLEGMQNEITDYRNQIDQLTKERNAASADEKFQYTAEIQEKENNIKQTEYNIESKKAEMEKKRNSIDNAVVTSKIAGVVKSINNSGSSDYGYEEESAYMTVLAVGDYRVKGTVSESNIQMLSEEQPVILRSRIDEEQTWEGTISKIDTQNAESNDNNDMYYYDSGSAEKATKYPFYVTLDSTDGLMMGQHLYIELDQGQTEEKEGIWLFESYIVWENPNGEDAADTEAGAEDMSDTEAGTEDMSDMADMEAGAEDMSDSEAEDGMDADAEGAAEDEPDADAEDGADMETDAEDGSDMDADAGQGGDAGERTAFVWAANDKNRLEKRQVELGEYDEMTGEYEILSGLTEDDYIAFPMEGLYEGITTVTNMEEVDYTSPLYNPEGDGEISGDEEGINDGAIMDDEEFRNDADFTDGEEFIDDEEYIDDEEFTDEDMSDEEDMSDSDMESMLRDSGSDEGSDDLGAL